MKYSPFVDNNNNFKAINEINYNDLYRLVEIKEGYSIEYKSEFNGDTKKKIPNIATSFANTEGGWIFIGVNNDGTINDIELPRADAYETISQLIVGYVSPKNLKFEVKTLHNTINKGFGVIACYIHEGFHCPYISRGTVYIRAGSRNEPVTSDRATIDLLYQKANKASLLDLKCFDGRINDKLIFSEFTFPENTPFALYHDLLKDIKYTELLLQNNGQNYDENIELTLIIEKDCFFDRIGALIPRFNMEEDYLEKLFSTRAQSYINEYDNNPFFSRPQIPTRWVNNNVNMGFGKSISVGGHLEEDENDRDYRRKIYMNIINSVFCYEQFKNSEGATVLKFRFKSLKAKESKFLPCLLLFYKEVDEIKYEILSDYANCKIEGLITK